MYESLGILEKKITAFFDLELAREPISTRHRYGKNVSGIDTNDLRLSFLRGAG